MADRIYKGTIFEGNGIKTDCELLDEWFFVYENLKANRISAVTKTYRPDDRLELSGESFAYPEYFDILILKDNAAVKIRRGIVEDIFSADNYVYGGLPVVNGRGMELLIRSAEDLEAFRTDNSVLDKVSEPVILNRWLRPCTFRRIYFSSSYQDIDYII